ncbi:ABC transporter substrate-binding protein [Sulfobacillus harzensis]|uniref:ABC transporter substrate-binding protein n=1 Tax=Sulfobacillus harzensis TaxID=2729629 RepID=A0A7Y0Q3Y0_9FIRM|nr:ABC transporter substrate-binding protein [Sulfobacillus harzensis]NMP23840.1 ABC transporter substrate-binding protein [Sulfobacillus harzensis]
MILKTKVGAGAAAALLSASFLAGCGSTTTSASGGSSKGGSVTIVSLRGTSGPTASLGVPGNNALQTEVNAINAKGGLLGKKITLKLLNTEGSPNIASTDARQAVLSDNAVAMFGGVSSGDGVYEEEVAKKYKTLLFSYTFNDAVFTRTSDFTPYFFSVVPNTNMEPMAAALVFKKEGWTKIYTISPNYNYGRAEVKGFLAALKKLGVHYTLLGQQWPALGASNFTSNITAILAAHPQAVYGGIYGSDLLTFTKEAEGYGFFKKTHFAAQYGSIDLQALGSAAPVGAVGFARGGWWTINNPQVTAWAKQYHSQYGAWPSSYSMLGTMAFDAWVYGVKKAHSFNSTKVSQALAGANIPSIFGSFTIRGCDHQAEIPESIGVISNKPNPYGFDTYSPTYNASWSNISQACPASN